MASFDPADLTAFIQANSIDRVVVTTPDYTHADYIVESLEAGADVVVEKPLTIDAEGCRRITKAVAETGRNVVVTFNYRYSPRNSALRQLIQSGVIGKVTSVDFSWVLDTVHGADYFRRWHREKKNSGGLLIHKASHHFDLVNWWIDDVPERVFASGGLSFYGAENAAARGLGHRPERGTPDAGSPADRRTRIRSRWTCATTSASRPSTWTTSTTTATSATRTSSPAASPSRTTSPSSSTTRAVRRLSYSLNAHSPWEGYRVAVNGTEGRAELEVVERGAVLAARTRRRWSTRAPRPSRRRTPSAARASACWCSGTGRPAYEVPIVNGEGGHGGGDALLLSDLFDGPGDDPLGRPSGYLDGVRSISVGIAGNRSLESSLPVRIDDLDLGIDLRRRAALGRGLDLKEPT